MFFEVALVIFSGVALPIPREQACMQHNVAFASDAKQRHISTLEVLEDFIPSSEIDKSSGNQIICSSIRKCKVRWVICKNLIAMRRA